ncbi:MAG TPA: HAMP domain-containing sensor histidine kinase [Actinoplanes sp.]|nr:HAMP domain-containing sensor histidine kinase [Actinoplanes sp.]
MADRRPRGSLLLRLLVLSAIVSLLSVAATAWLAVRTTTQAIQQEQSQALSDDARIYDAVLGYAATHADWADVAPLISSLASRTGHRIALTDRARAPIADSASGPLPTRASATVDPLSLDPNLVAAGTGRIDPRAVGPFRLTAAERATLQDAATRVVGCLREPPAAPAQNDSRTVTRDAEIVDEPSGRPHLVIAGGESVVDLTCAEPRAALAEPTATETRALNQLSALTNVCLSRQRIPAVQVGLQNTWIWVGPDSARTGKAHTAAVTDCLAGARREQLARYVAPPVLLFVTTPGRPASPGFDLSAANRARIIGVAGLVLLIAVAVTTLVGMRLVRPLRALTAAAGRMRDGDAGAQVEVVGRDEIARLGAAFNDMAERRRHVEQLRQAMVGDVAHELRTPVTNIRGWLEAAEDGVVPLDRDLASSLLEEALLLQHVIDDLQDLAAADAGELRLYPRPVEVAELLSAVTESFARSAERAGVALTAAAPPVTAVLDPIRLRQALGNLVANAIRHTPPGGRVTLSARTVDGQLILDVTDTGPGIPAEQQAVVFERFWRAEPSRNRRTGGSGLGLSIVRKLAEAHGGTVAVTSAPGAGATFTLRLPVVPARLRSAPPP